MKGDTPLRQDQNKVKLEEHLSLLLAAEQTDAYVYTDEAGHEADEAGRAPPSPARRARHGEAGSSAHQGPFHPRVLELGAPPGAAGGR